MTQEPGHVQTLCEELLREVDPAAMSAEAFLGEQFDRGLAWVHFPQGHGGLGLTPALQSVVDDVLGAAGAPQSAQRNPLGHGMGAPTILTHGSDEQRRRYLRPLFTGEEIWCQLFSEPGAGSDIAGLGTRAERTEHGWLLNGQKVWTTLAHLARWGLLVARTDPDAPKHRGLTYFVLDMQAAGIEVRPLYQITGEAEFNEVFLHDVQVEDGQRLGRVGEGWSVVLTTLMNERVAVGGGIPPRGSGFIAEAMEIWASRPGNTVERDRLAQLWIQAEVLRLTNLRSAQSRSTGNPGAEGSIGKVMAARLHQDISSFAVGLLGAAGMLKPDGYRMTRSATKMWENPQQAFLRARANSIEGGTTEIAKNVLGERVLGLPGDVRVDKDIPWHLVPRS